MVDWKPKPVDALGQYWNSLVGGNGEHGLSASAKLTVPMITLEGVKQAADLLHELANTLGRHATRQPGDPRNDDLVRLGMCRSAVHQAQHILKRIKKAEIQVLEDIREEDRKAEIRSFGIRG